MKRCQAAQRRKEGLRREGCESPRGMARSEKKGHGACCAERSSSPCDDDDDDGISETNNVCFASSTSRTYRRMSNSSAQVTNTKHADTPSSEDSRIQL